MLPAAPASGRLPGIVILQGSTSNMRREYQFYADHFARAGLAVVTFDKRGTGESSGNYAAATYDDLAADAAAAVQNLRRQPEIDSARVGVWGLSQGAFIAPLVARRVASIAFIVAVRHRASRSARARRIRTVCGWWRKGFRRRMPDRRRA